MTYLITGGAGFIGSTLVDKLIDKNKVIVLDNFCDFYDPKIKEENIKKSLNSKNYILYRGDIRDTELLNKIFIENNIDVVIHLAAMAGVRSSIENPQLYYDVNCIGTENILSCMKKYHIKKIIMASSSSVYGNNSVPFKENMCTDYPISPYAMTKKTNELMAYVYHELEKTDVIILRFFTVYGPHQRPDLAINKFTKLMLNDEEIPMYGNGKTKRDYTYIDDIIDGIIKSSEYINNNRNIYEIINLGSGNPITLMDMIKIISEVLNIIPKIKKLPMQDGDVNITYANIEKAKKILDYEPKTSFYEGIVKYIEWYKKNRHL